MAKQGSNRDLKQIEKDLDHNRDRMGTTLEALQQRLSPTDVVNQAFESWGDSGGREFAANLQRSITQNPVPVGLLGLGVAWLMVSGSSRTRDNGSALDALRSDGSAQGENQGSGRVKSAVSGAGSRAKGAAQSARHGAGQAANSGRAGVRNMSDGARRGASRAGAASRRGADQARRGFDYMLHEEPLITGAIGVALGALVAASLPRTGREDEMMGETRDGLVDSARSTGEEQARKARHVAESALDAAGDAASRESEQQGLGRRD